MVPWTTLACGILDLSREIQLALIQIKEKMAIYVAVILFAMVILIKALAHALQQP
jgi:preprotein translocase subunit Sec61beta